MMVTVETNSNGRCKRLQAVFKTRKSTQELRALDFVEVEHK